MHFLVMTKNFKGEASTPVDVTLDYCTHSLSMTRIRLFIVVHPSDQQGGITSGVTDTVARDSSDPVCYGNIRLYRLPLLPSPRYPTK